MAGGFDDFVANETQGAALGSALGGFGGGDATNYQTAGQILGGRADPTSLGAVVEENDARHQATRNSMERASRQFQMKKAMAEAQELYKAGDAKGALMAIGRVDPQVFATQLAADLGIDRDIDKAKRAYEEVPTTTALETDSGIYNITKKGDKISAKLLTALAPKGKDEKPLSDTQLKSIEEGANSSQAVQGLRDGMKFLLDQNKIGPITGRAEQVKNYFGLADPTSAEYQNTRGLVTLGIAKQTQGGRPSDVDAERIDRVMAEMSNRPETAFYTMAQLQSNIDTDREQNALVAESAATPEQKPALQRAIKAAGIDIERAKKLQAVSQKAGISGRSLRTGLTLLQQFQQNPNAEYFKHPDVKAAMSRTIDALEKSNAESLLTGEAPQE